MKVALPHAEVARRRAAMDDESAQLAAECLDCYAAKLRRYPPVSTFRLWVIGARTHAGKLSQLAHGKGSVRHLVPRMLATRHLVPKM